MSNADTIRAQLSVLIGLKLSIARRAADMRVFHFGAIRTVESGTMGDYALHIQCPWRIEGQDGIVTGSSDLWESAEIDAAIDWKHWNYDKDPNLQDTRMHALLGSYDPQTRSVVNVGHLLVVEAMQADNYGGMALVLSGGYRLVVFPSGSQGEDWRIFQTEKNKRHFVVGGGNIT